MHVYVVNGGSRHSSLMCSLLCLHTVYLGMEHVKMMKKDLVDCPKVITEAGMSDSSFVVGGDN